MHKLYIENAKGDWTKIAADRDYARLRSDALALLELGYCSAIKMKNGSRKLFFNPDHLADLTAGQSLNIP